MGAAHDARGMAVQHDLRAAELPRIDANPRLQAGAGLDELPAPKQHGPQCLMGGP